MKRYFRFDFYDISDTLCHNGIMTVDEALSLKYRYNCIGREVPVAEAEAMSLTERGLAHLEQ